MAAAGRSVARPRPRPRHAPTAAAAVPPEAQHGGNHWRADTIGLLLTLTSTPPARDPCPQVPAAFVDPTRIV